MEKAKIIFIGTSTFAVPALAKLIKEKYQLVKVITSPDKPVGRQQEIVFSPVKKAALKLKLPLCQPADISSIKEELIDLQPELIILAAYGQIIPQEIIEIPANGSLNLHPSLLPKYRGPSPIQTAILRGEIKTGLTIMLMDDKIDHGPIVTQQELRIKKEDNYQTLEKRLAKLAADLLLNTLPDYLNKKIKPIRQQEEKATYTKIITRPDGRIDWSQEAIQISRQIRAFYPWPGAWTEFNNLRIKILKAKAVSRKQPYALPTAKGYLLLETVQPAGKKPMSGADFFRGYHLTKNH